MDYKYENDTLTIALEGRISSLNAEETEKGIFEIMDSNPHSSLVLDAEKLEYISSAGLRIILKVRKKTPEMKIVNVSQGVYTVFEETGFAEMMTVEKGYRTMSIDGCEVIGKGAKGTVYRYDEDTIVKVYKPGADITDAKRERELARKAFILGVPTAISYDIVKVGECFGSVFELLSASSVSRLIKDNPDRISEYARLSADLLKSIHDTEIGKGELPDIKETIRKWAEGSKDAVGESTCLKLSEMIEAVPDVNRMIHGDFHTNNIMMQNGEAILIDMDTLSSGHPVFELANVYIAYVGFGTTDPSMVENFIGFDYENAVKFWNLFIRYYLGSEDESYVEEVENKIKLLSDLRLLRHTLRRGGFNGSDGKEVIDFCVSDIGRLLGTVSSLDF